jgi:FtsP/CotA-like multicopper oxidase with cupredoxin domain
VNDALEASRLLQTDQKSTHDDDEFLKKTDAENSGRDYSKWLRPFGLFSSTLILAIIVVASAKILSQTSHLGIFSYSYSGTSGSENFNFGTTIALHPELHVSQAPSTITHQWNITSAFLYPDGVRKEVYLINEQFPGPTIECRSGDRLVIHVTNSLPSEDVSIHWHGLHMRNANSMDGAVGFTQCPIPAGGEFTYEFDVSEEQSGTFWWHSHSQVQRGDGMYGGLVVHAPIATKNDMKDYVYEKEVLLLVGDWYHQRAQEVLDWFTSAIGFGNEVCSSVVCFYRDSTKCDQPSPDSMVINGAGKFICSMAVPAKPVDCIDSKEEPIVGLPGFGISTRVRIVNVGYIA